MIKNETKDNHYVHQYYLKSFLNENKSIYLKDLKNNQIYENKSPNAVKTICVKKNLYTIKKKITENDVLYFTKLFGLLPIKKDDEKFLSFLVRFLNDDLGDLFAIKIKDKNKEDKFNEFLRNKLNNPDISRNQETLFTFYENEFNYIHEKILKEKTLSFLEKDNGNFKLYLRTKIIGLISKEFGKLCLDAIEYQESSDILKNFNFGMKNSYYDFLHFIIIQFFRVQKNMNFLSCPRLDKEEKDLLKSKDINHESIPHLFIHYQSINIASSFFKDNFKFILIRNESNIDFITSDNPCMNKHYKEFQNNQNCEKAEIYFPLSPKLAVLYSKEKQYENIKEFSLKKDSDINNWNNILKDNAERYIYGNSRNLLEKYKFEEIR